MVVCSGGWELFLAGLLGFLPGFVFFEYFFGLGGFAGPCLGLGLVCCGDFGVLGSLTQLGDGIDGGVLTAGSADPADTHFMWGSGTRRSCTCTGRGAACGAGRSTTTTATCTRRTATTTPRRTRSTTSGFASPKFQNRQHCRYWRWAVWRS